MDNVITDPEQVTPEWLTAKLRANGYLGQGEVITVRQRDTVHRVSLNNSWMLAIRRTPLPLLHPNCSSI